MENMILTLHIIVCVVLIILVLLQSGKDGMGVIFGGGSSSLFGGSGAGGILVKLTMFLAILFIATSLGYNIVTSGGAKKESTILEMQIDDPTKPADMNKVVAPVTQNATVETTNATDSASVVPTTNATSANVKTTKSKK